MISVKLATENVGVVGVGSGVGVGVGVGAGAGLFAIVTLICAVLVAPFVSVATAFSTYAPSAWFKVQNSQVYGATFSVRNSLSFGRRS